MKALLCGCGRHLEARDDERLVREVLYHLGRDHPGVEFDESRVRRMVSEHSFRYECVEVHAGGIGPEEGFGEEPY